VLLTLSRGGIGDLLGAAVQLQGANLFRRSMRSFDATQEWKPASKDFYGWGSTGFAQGSDVKVMFRILLL
jgi:hypothetical protein